MNQITKNFNAGWTLAFVVRNPQDRTVWKSTAYAAWATNAMGDEQIVALVRKGIC